MEVIRMPEMQALINFGDVMENAPGNKGAESSTASVMTTLRTISVLKVTRRIFFTPSRLFSPLYMLRIGSIASERPPNNAVSPIAYPTTEFTARYSLPNRLHRKPVIMTPFKLEKSAKVDSIKLNLTNWRCSANE